MPFRPLGSSRRRSRALPPALALLALGCAGAQRGASGPSPASGSSGAEVLVGGCGPAPPGLEAKYILPFPEGEAFPLSQGNCGDASHEGRFAFAFDFRMPVGTPVIAARDGVVLGVRSGRPNGTGRVGDENYIFLRHPDDEVSRYIHLDPAGVWVEPGQPVERGDTIGLSGHSGRSAFPHLHFDVARGCESGPCVTVWAAFRNATPAIPRARGTVRAGATPR